MEILQCLMSNLEAFHSYENINNVGERLKNQGFCMVLLVMTFKQGGLLIVPQLL